MTPLDFGGNLAEEEHGPETVSTLLTDLRMQPDLLRVLKQGTKINDNGNVDWDAELVSLLASEAALV